MRCLAADHNGPRSAGGRPQGGEGVAHNGEGLEARKREATGGNASTCGDPAGCTLHVVAERLRLRLDRRHRAATW